MRECKLKSKPLESFIFLNRLKTITLNSSKKRWFDGFRWDQLEDRTLPAPLKRPVKDNTDLSNFDEYPRDRDEPPGKINFFFF